MKPFSSSLVRKWSVAPNQRPAPPGLPLIGPRLMIRPFELEDEAKRQAWVKFTDPYLVKFNFEPRSPRINRATHLRLFDRLRLSIDNLLGELIGYLSLKPVAGKSKAGELGVCFAADQVGKGYGEEALRLLLSWAAQELELSVVFLEVDQVNQRAIRLYTRLGFVKVREYWKEEEHPALYEHFSGSEIPPEFRKKGRHLEVLTWVMEWTKP